MSAVALRPGDALTNRQLGWALGIGVFAGLASASRPAVAIGVAAALPFLLLTSLRTKVLTYFAVLPLIGGVKYQFPNTEVQGAPDLIALALLIHLGWQLVTGEARFPFQHPYVTAVLLYATTVIAQAFAPLVVAQGVNVSGARIYLEPMVIFAAGVVVLRQPETPRLFLRVAVISGGLVGLYMLKQLIFGFSPAELAFQASRLNFRTVAEQRLFSTLSGPAVFGFASGAFVILSLMARAMNIWPRTALAVASVSALGVVASGTRIVLIAMVPAFAVAVTALFTDVRTKYLATGMLTVGLCGAMALAAILAVTPVPETRDETLESPNPIVAAIEKLALLKQGSADDDWAARVDRTGDFLDFIGRRPWGSGTGFTLIVDETAPPQPGTFRGRTDLPRYVEGEKWIFRRDFYYFALGVELGLLPLLLFLGILGGGLVMAVREWRRTTEPTAKVMLALSASILALTLVHNLTNESFRAPQVSGYVWFMLAVPVAFGTGRVRQWLPSYYSADARSSAVSLRK